MNDFVQILTKYWGYTKFRDLQEEIIQSVYDGNDTLALLPTGGGKSITFQVPAMAKPGICIVVTPLIALMKDQVENLKSKGIKALAVYSGLSKHEIEIIYDNCAYGDYKFLYISPERLANDFFKERVKNFNVNLIAIDEAHCISQWGYDFRPAYLKIADLRQIIPDAPVLALTATATKNVVVDIQDKLLFKNGKFFQKSFVRKNLIYVVRYADDKNKQLLEIIRKVGGSGVVYLRSRRGTREIAEFLRENNISADHYHAGLNMQTRDKKQERWMSGKTQVIVATNAFGMGIDKSNVRFVIHTDLPDSIEAYFQEAGRAGRDGKKSYAVLLINRSDETKLKANVSKSFPPKSVVKDIYQMLGSFCKLPYHEGKGLVSDFNLFDFCKAYSLNYITAFNSLKILEQAEYIELTDELNNPSRLIFMVQRDELYKFQVANAKFDRLIKLILRTYTGLFNNYVKIDEEYLSKSLNLSRDVLYDMLKLLSSYKIINYIPQKQTPLVVFVTERMDEKSLIIPKESYEFKKKAKLERMNSVLNYAFSDSQCRSVHLLRYFGEHSDRCGYCDYCQRRNELGLSVYEFDKIIEQIKAVLENGPVRLETLVDKISGKNEKTIKVITWLFQSKKIHYTKDKNIEWINKLFK